MIEIKNLSHSFGKNNVLKDINLTLEDGKIYGLIGINGAGKSTLMRLLSSVYRPSQGEIWIEGEKLDSSYSHKELILYMPDDNYYNSKATQKYLAKMYQIFYPRFDMSLFYTYINRFNLKENDKVIHFSKGMRRRLFLCLAIACRVKYLFLDEAFDGLDPLARIEFNHFLLEALEHNTMTVLISSHSLKDLEEIMDSYIILDSQSVLASGKMMESFEQYVKYQMAFTTPILAEEFADLQPTELKIVGKIVQIVVRRQDGVLEKLEALHPVMIEEIEMDFNDYFTNLVMEGGKHI